MNLKCVYCHAECLSCNGEASNQCLSCLGPKALHNTNCVDNCPSGFFKNSVTNICVTSCPIGFYGNTSNNECQPCDPSCYSCTGPLTTNCDKCSGLRFLKFGGTECLTTCPLTTYALPYTNNNRCELCLSGCQLCTGPNLINC